MGKLLGDSLYVAPSCPNIGGDMSLSSPEIAAHTWNPLVEGLPSHTPLNYGPAAG